MSQQTMATQNRALFLEDMANEPLDLLVIGGGITGAGVALDAVSRGLRVGLVEQSDFGGGTSSRSTKLIHGGLRYLKQGEVGLVREVGRERAILHRNAPHIVIPLPMLLPIVEHGTYGRFATSVGLWVYDRLAGVEPSERRRMLSRDAALEAEPLLRDDILRGAGLYYEYRTDDARLTIEVLKTATALGAKCVNYAAATELMYDGDHRVQGALIHDRVQEQDYTVRADKVVNAAGPWVDELRRWDRSLERKRLHLTKGVHIVVPRDRMPIRQSIYFDVQDGRMVFAIPRGRSTYIGTTDTDYEGPLDQIYASPEDVRYLLRASNDMFPSVRLTAADIIATWAGVRPLIHEDGKGPSELSRRDEIFLSDSGLITIAGGKLTGFRKMAERTVDVVLRKLVDEGKQSWVPSRTDRLTLSGGDLGGLSPANYIRELAAEAATHDVEDLFYKYGTNTQQIIDSARRGECTLLQAEVRYAVDHEMVVELNDFLVRRTGRLYFERDRVLDTYPQVEEELASKLSWGEARRIRTVAEFRLEYAAVYQAVTQLEIPAEQAVDAELKFGKSDDHT